MDIEIIFQTLPFPDLDLLIPFYHGRYNDIEDAMVFKVKNIMDFTFSQWKFSDELYKRQKQLTVMAVAKDNALRETQAKLKATVAKLEMLEDELKSKTDDCSQLESNLRKAQKKLAHFRSKPVMRNQLSQTVKPEPVTAATQVKSARDDTAMYTVRPELLRQEAAALECATSASSCTSSNSRRSFAVSTKQPRCKFKCSSRHDTASCDRYPVGQLTQRKFLTNLKMNNRSFFDTLVSSTTRSPEQFHASTLKHSRQSDRRAVPLCHQCQHKGHWTSECSKVNIGKMTMARWLEFLCKNNECFYEKLKIKQKLNNFYLTCLRYTFQ